MFEKIKTAVLVFLLVFSGAGYGADENGFAWSYSPPSCGEWVAERNNMGSDYITGKLHGFEMWMVGYLSAYNILVPDNFDIRGNTDIESMRLWLDKYCRENPLEDLGGAMQDLTNELYPNRTVKAPE